MKNAKIHAEINADGINLEIAGKGEDILFLLSFVISDITEKSKMPTDVFISHLSKAIIAYKIAEKMAEDET